VRAHTDQGLYTHGVSVCVKWMHARASRARLNRKPGAPPNLSVGQRRGHRTRPSGARDLDHKLPSPVPIGQSDLSVLAGETGRFAW